MDAITPFVGNGYSPITCVEMHTTGEPTRIITHGYPDISGTLLEQRAEAHVKHDHIRRRLLLEPVGHADMYGAILRPDTELTSSGEAHIGVLFCHNAKESESGYSTMCGHATLALGRFLLDTQDRAVFPKRDEIVVDKTTLTAVVNLHAPCGLVRITVPVTEDGKKSDASRPVSFINVPSFSTGDNVVVTIPEKKKWPEIQSKTEVRVSFCYGGAFTLLVDIEELGFGKEGLKNPNHEGIDRATKALKEVVNNDPHFEQYLQHPEHEELNHLYTIIVRDTSLGSPAEGSLGAETGLCFFAEQQIDRSPTGSAASARVAHAYATGKRKLGEPWTYHSLVSVASDGRGGFVGTPVEEVLDYYRKESMLGIPVRVQIEGYTYYVGYHIFVVEKEDPLAQGGFLLNRLGGEGQREKK
jgi:trans-L-3-hydroxyproline dehydratase